MLRDLLHVWLRQTRTAQLVSLYALNRSDRSTARFMAERAVDRFVELAGLTVHEMANRIRADEVDVLIDLSGMVWFRV